MHYIILSYHWTVQIPKTQYSTSHYHLTLNTASGDTEGLAKNRSTPLYRLSKDESVLQLSPDWEMRSSKNLASLSKPLDWLISSMSFHTSNTAATFSWCSNIDLRFDSHKSAPGVGRLISCIWSVINCPIVTAAIRLHSKEQAHEASFACQDYLQETW